VVIRVGRIAWDRAFYDPHARRRDLEDARYRGQVVWMDAEEAKERWPNKLEEIEAAITYTDNSSDTYEDHPPVWVDRRRQRVRVVEMWYWAGRIGEGKCYQAIFTRGGMLKGATPSPYLNDEGRPEDPFVFTSAFIAQDGSRYGPLNQLLAVQDEINKRRSKALHLLSVRQVRAEKGAVEDVANARKEIAKPDGWIETVAGFAFEVLPTGDMAQAQFSLLAEAKAEIDAVGANAALAGKANEGASGRAIQARQQGGQLEVGPMFDQLRSFQRRVSRKVWGRIRQYWDREKWVRVTDDPEAPEFVGLNAPVYGPTPQALMALHRARAAGDERAYQQLVEMVKSGDNPALSVQVGVENRVAEMDMDIVVSDAPDTVTLEGEQFQIMADLARGGVPIPPAALVEASGLNRERKRKVLEAIEGTPEEQQARAQEARRRQQLEDEKTHHEAHAKHAKATRDEAEADQTRTETAILKARSVQPILPAAGGF
jgi:hypothetical protein